MSKRSINDSSGDTSIAKRPSHDNDLHQSDADSSNSNLSQSSVNLKAPKVTTCTMHKLANFLSQNDFRIQNLIICCMQY